MYALEVGSDTVTAAASSGEDASDDKSGGVPSLFRRSDTLPYSEPPPMPSPRVHEDGGIGDTCLVPPLAPPASQRGRYKN